MNNFKGKVILIWNIADLLQGYYRQANYGKVILPFTLLRRFDLVFAPTKQAVLQLEQETDGMIREIIN